MKTAVYTSFCLCCLWLVALPASGATAAPGPAPVLAQAAVPVSAPLLGTFPIQQPVPQSACTLQIECDNGSVISCTGNSSCQTTNGGNCAVCDGVEAGCCAKTCCQVCDENWASCNFSCDPSIPRTCTLCDRAYNFCVSNCTGGCG